MSMWTPNMYFTWLKPMMMAAPEVKPGAPEVKPRQKPRVGPSLTKESD